MGWGATASGGVCVCVIMSSPLWVPTSANYEATSGLADK